MAWWSRRSKARGRHALGRAVPSRPDGPATIPAPPVSPSSSVSAPPPASSPVPPPEQGQRLPPLEPPIAAPGAGQQDPRPAAATPEPARPLGVRLALDVLPLDLDATPYAPTTPSAATPPDVLHGWDVPPVDLQLETSAAPGPAPAWAPLEAVTLTGATSVPADVAAEVALLLATGEAWDQPDTPAPAAPAVLPRTPAAPAFVPPAPAALTRAPVAPVPSAAVPAQVRRHVELVFRDGSSAALDPDGEQALALAELSALLTGRE